MDAFEARFTFFWYNDQEIFQDTQADMDAKLKKLADQGITHIMTFSCTHFRWAFRPWWDKLNDCLAKIVIAAHKCDIKVIEHHSSELVWYPNTPKRLARLETQMRGHHSAMESWPGIVEYLTGPDSPAIHSVQINEKTRLPHVSGYDATSKCYNDPEYRREYLKYLESVYATGVDGIMTDDVQYYCSCCCEHCRRLFKEQSGYELPAPEKWDAWHGNMRDPSFVAWLRFRFDSTHAFHALVKAHYDKLGLKLLRPNYTSLAITRDWTAANVESVPQLDWYFQEVAHSCVIRYTWPKSLAEQKHRAMVAGLRDIPHGLLYYAYDNDNLVFSWGSTMLAGGFYVNTPEGASVEVNETAIRAFEKKYARQLFHADLMASVGFIDSRENRYFAPGYEMSRMEFWIEACIFNRIPCRMVSVEHPETWSSCRVLSINEVHLLADRQMAAMRAFAENGGILLISGIPGCEAENCRIRTAAECEKIWGFSLRPKDAHGYEIYALGKGKVCVVGAMFGYPGADEGKAAMFLADHMDFPFGKMPYEHIKSIGFICAGRVLGKNVRVENKIGALYAGFAVEGAKVGKLIADLVGSELKFKAELPELVLAEPFVARDGKSITIRLLNAAGTLTPPGDGKTIAHDDPIPFLPWSGPDGKLTVSLPASMAGAECAELVALAGAPRKLQTARNGNELTVTLPAGALKDFAMILVK